MFSYFFAFLSSSKIQLQVSFTWSVDSAAHEQHGCAHEAGIRRTIKEDGMTDQAWLGEQKFSGCFKCIIATTTTTHNSPIGSFVHASRSTME